MANTAILDLRFPSAGLNRRRAFREQPPFSTADALNVRPDGLGRDRGGSRPGLMRILTQLPDPINMMGTVNFITKDSFDFFDDSFAGSAMSAAWTAASWLGGLPAVQGSMAYLDSAATRGAVYSTVADFDTTKDYVVEAFLMPHLGTHSATYQIFLRMDDTDPLVTTDGVAVELSLAAGGSYSGAAKVYSDGSLVAEHAFTPGARNADKPAWLRCKISDTSYSTGQVVVEDGVVTLTGGEWPSWAADATFRLDGASYEISSIDSSTQLTLVDTSVTKAATGATFSRGLVRVVNGVVSLLSGAFPQWVTYGTLSNLVGSEHDIASRDDDVTLTLVDTSVTYGDGLPMRYLIAGEAGSEYSLIREGCDLTVTWDGEPLLSNQGIVAQAGSRFGFGMSGVGANQRAQVDRFRFQYYRTGNYQRIRNLLVVGAGGKLYRESFLGELEEVESAIGLNPDRTLMCAEFQQKLYIADIHDEILSGDKDDDSPGMAHWSVLLTAKISEIGEGEGQVTTYGSYLMYGMYSFSVPGYESPEDWIAAGLDIKKHALEIIELKEDGGFNDGRDAIVGTYSIDYIADNGLLIVNGRNSLAAKEDEEIIVSAARAATWRIVEPPRVYDPAKNEIGLLRIERESNLTFGSDSYVRPKNYGSIPINCPIVFSYNARLGFAAPPNAPGGWFMSRQEDATDWFYGGDAGDYRRPIAGGTSVSRVGEPIRAVIPNGHELLLGCAQSIWRMSGDPAMNVAGVTRVTDRVGVFGRFSWCRTPNNEILTAGPQGVYMVGGDAVELISDRIAGEIANTQPSQQDILMAYDVRERGAMIFLPATADTAGIRHWWLQWAGVKGFWPESYATDHTPVLLCDYDAVDPEDSSVLLATDGGLILRHFDKWHRDDGTEIDSFVIYGPLNIGGSGNFYDGQVMQIIGELSSSSADVLASLSVDRSAEGAAVGAANWSYTFKAIAAHTWRPMGRGSAMAIKLAGVASAPGRWAIERLTAVIGRHGKQRA